MEDKKRIMALVVDPLDDSMNVHLLERQLDLLGVKYKFFKDIDETIALKSVLIILNEQCQYGSDASLFIHYAIINRIPMIVIYTDMNDNKDIHDSISFTHNTIKLWNKIPAFEEERYKVATVHILLGNLKQIINRNDFVKGTLLDPSDYYLLTKEEK